MHFDYCFDSGIPLVAFIGGNELEKGVVNVKILNTKEQIEVPRTEFVQKVKELIEAHPVLIAQPEVKKEEKKEERKRGEKKK